MRTPVVSETTTLGPYVLLERLDPRAEVYRARHEVLDREVVVKLARRDPQDEEAWHRFEREARAAARVDHPGVVRVFDFGQAEEGLAYLAQELVPGESLRSRLERGTLGASEWLRVARGLAAGLGAIHAADLVHRDLKPENVVLDENEQPKVIDFGLVRDLDSGSRVTGSNQLVGTPLYAAPEQARGDSHSAAPAADIYALGCLLHEAWVGRVPHASGTRRLRDFLRRRAQGNLELAENAPLPALLAAMLAPEPEERPDAKAALHVLNSKTEQDLLGGQAAVATTRVDLERVQQEAAPAPSNRAELLIPLAVLAGLALLTSLAGFAGARAFAPASPTPLAAQDELVPLAESSPAPSALASLPASMAHASEGPASESPAQTPAASPAPSPDSIDQALGYLREQRWVQASGALTGARGPEAEAARWLTGLLARLSSREPLDEPLRDRRLRGRLHEAPRVRAFLEPHQLALGGYVRGRHLVESGRFHLLRMAIGQAFESLEAPLELLPPERQHEPQLIAHLTRVSVAERSQPAQAREGLEKLLASPLLETPLGQAARPQLEAWLRRLSR